MAAPPPPALALAESAALSLSALCLALTAPSTASNLAQASAAVGLLAGSASQHSLSRRKTSGSSGK